MRSYPEAAWERAMKVQDVILRAMAKKLTWWQAAEILGISDRRMAQTFSGLSPPLAPHRNRALDASPFHHKARVAHFRA